ncbi:hypothetical protein CBR_g37928 [Chara braunii]|uniref:Reverse transcriptase/retrotransposon-derived protein RNase H-like domain-containing protein n=1 Tax=Chara braunii TaxID=69332 RepID=A0A388LPB7_CHABU|nr:hypothetical protein CBR_g37928 [Chara braunii]|eukprot:GBG84052.1 hypothetical protein CBR_g37928 [Chara braunii]
MKSRTWKWNDIEKRLVKAGVTIRKAEEPAVQIRAQIHGTIGEAKFLHTNTGGEEGERFDFRMDERVYSEMNAMSKADHTIHPTNLADTGAAGGVKMVGPGGGRNESVASEGCGDGQDDDQGSTRDSTFNCGSAGGGGKRKNVRQQTFDAIADVMDKHGKLMATTVDNASKRQCLVLTRQSDILEREVEVQKQHYEKADLGNLMMCNAFLEIAKAIRKERRDSGLGKGGEGQKGRGHVPRSKRLRVDEASSENDDDFQSEEVVVVHAQRMSGSQRLGFGQDGVLRDQLAAIGQVVAGGAVGVSPRTHKTQGIVINEARVQRQVVGVGEEMASGVRAPIVPVVGGGRLDKAVIGAVQPCQALPVQQASAHRGETGNAHHPRVDLQVVVEVEWLCSCRVIHHRRLHYGRRTSCLVGLEWSRVVSPTLIYYTLQMKMDMPLWFAGVKIVDKPEDDDMTAQQEATILRMVECWTDALWCGQWADGGKLKQERLTRLADCLRVLLSACMWIMRMGGDDDRSHYEAGLYASLTAKPTLIAAGSYIFNWTRHIVDSANLVLDRLGKPYLKLGEYSHCILEWVDCGLVCDHNAALKNAAEAAKHDWTDSGPPAVLQRMKMAVTASDMRGHLEGQSVGVVVLRGEALRSPGGGAFDAGFKVALEKSEFFLSEISFLGYIVTVDGLKPDPRKVAAVQDAPAPVTLTQVRAILGLASYYQCFIKGFVGIAKPLTNLLKKEKQLIWTPECEAAFQALKEALTSAPVLARPDPTRPFALYTDWQPQAISAVLTQHDKDGREHIIEYASKKLSQAQANYEACKAEKEGMVALYPFAQLQTIDPGLLELIHLELLSIAQVIASEEEEIQPRLRTATAPRRTYNAVVIPDYIAQRAERLEDFPEERPLRPPSSYPRPAPPKAPKKTPKRKRRHPSPGAQGSRIGGGEEVIQPPRTRIPNPVPGSAATLVKETIVPSPPIPRVPDLNLDGVGPSSAAAAGGGSRMGFLDPISRPPEETDEEEDAEEDEEEEEDDDDDDDDDDEEEKEEEGDYTMSCTWQRKGAGIMERRKSRGCCGDTPQAFASEKYGEVMERVKDRRGRLTSTLWLLLLVSIFLPAGWSKSLQSVPELENAMYKIIDNTPCVRLLTLSGEIGCSNPGRTVVRAPIQRITDPAEQVKGFHSILLPIETFAPFMTRLRQDGKLAAMVAGVIVEMQETDGPGNHSLKAFSPASQFPQAEFAPYKDHVWNREGSDISRQRYNFPVVLLSKSSTQLFHKVRVAFRRPQASATGDQP